MSDLTSENNESMSQEIKPLIKTKKNTLNAFDSALATVSFILLQTIMMGIISLFPLSFRQIFFVSFTISLLVEAVFFFAGAFTCKVVRANILETTKLNKRPGILSVLLAIALSFISLTFFGNLTNVFVAVLEMFGYSQVISNIEIPNFLTYFIYVILLAVSPAFFEEFLFRGIILNGFKKLGTIGSVLLSALIFMLMHGGPDQTIHQFILGVILGFAYVYSGSLWVPIIIHFVNNFTAVTSIYISTLIGGASSSGATQMSYMWLRILISLGVALVLAGIGFALTYLCMYGIKKIKENRDTKLKAKMVDEEALKIDLTQNKNEEKLSKTKKIIMIILFVGCGIYFVAEWISALVKGFML